MISKKLATTLVLFVVLLLASPLVVHAITSGAKVIKLSPAPALSGQVSQALATTGSSQLPVTDKDFKLQNVRYFDDNSWAAASIIPIKNDFNSSIIVMQRKSGVYQTVLGPASAFPRNSLQSLPPDLAAYISKQGAVYEPVLE